METNEMLWIAGIGVAGLLIWEWHKGSLPASASSVMTSVLPSPAPIPVLPGNLVPVPPTTVTVTTTSPNPVPVTQTVPVAIAPIVSSGLPMVIDPLTAGAMLQTNQRAIDNMTMGSSIGTPFGTYSLQWNGLVTIDKVNAQGEMNLVAQQGTKTWKQYKGIA